MMKAEERLGPSRSVLARERKRRRALVVGTGGVIVLSAGAIFGHHAPADVEAVLAGRDHLWAICVIALHLLLEPAHRALHVLLVVGGVYAVADRARAWHSSRRVLRRLVGGAPSKADSFHVAALRAGVDPGRIRVVEGLPTPAFTAGWLRPRIYVARELEVRLSADELPAVLAHEGAHARKRDPLRLSVLRFVGCLFFWVPGVGRLVEDLADEAEIVADDAATLGRPLALAAAILTLASWGTGRRVGAETVGFSGRDLVERRVRRLAGEEVAPHTRLTRGSLVAGGFALALAWSSGTVVAHPLPAAVPGHAEHCDEHPAAATHLFCMGNPLTAPRGECPHAQKGRHA